MKFVIVLFAALSLVQMRYEHKQQSVHFKSCYFGHKNLEKRITYNFLHKRLVCFGYMQSKESLSRAFLCGLFKVKNQEI
jgi:hypothetical protein